MDTVTQLTLGAAIGEAVLGNKIGNKAPFWGALIGVVPDLDVLANPFLSEADQIIAHRGISHSLFFCCLAAPLFGFILSRFKWNREVGWKSWGWMVFWVIFTHIFIDVCTSYGTQVFQPFSNYAVSFNCIFIVDPFYTLPLMIGILTAMFLERGSGPRNCANRLGLVISSLYLLMGFGLKWHVNTVFQENFNERNITVDRYMTTPAPLSVFLWTGYAESGDTLYAGIYSVFDDERNIQLFEIPQRTQLIESYLDDLPVRRLLWFSNGYYSVEKRSGGIYFSDLRFGRSDLWLTDKDAPFVWNYKLLFDTDSTNVTGIRHFEPSFGAGTISFGGFLGRISGEE